MPSDWKVRPLSELTRNFDGVRRPVKEADRKAGPYPYYGASGVVDHVDGYLFDGEYLLVAEDGENLRSRKTPVAFLARGQFWVNNHAHVVQGNDQADTRFLMYALQGTDISGFLTGSTMPKLTQANLNRIPILAPGLDEQRAIAGVLGALDDKIEANRRNATALETFALALFRSRFEADEGIGRAADTATTFGELAALLRATVNPGAHPETVFAHYSLPAFDQGQLPQVERGGSIKSQKFAVPPSAVLLSKLNPEIERVWLPDVEEGGRAICSTEFLVLSAKAPITRAYLYCLCRSPGFRSNLVSLVGGTSKSHQRAQPEAVLSIPVDRPSPEAVRDFDAHAAAILRRAQVARLESAALADVRDLLAPRLLSGDLPAPELPALLGSGSR